jgi:hypothetical protein
LESTAPATSARCNSRKHNDEVQLHAFDILGIQFLNRLFEIIRRGGHHANGRKAQAFCGRVNQLTILSTNRLSQAALFNRACE